MLDGHVVVVTGGAGVIGRVFCRALVAAHAHVVIAEKDLDGAHALCAEIAETYPGQITACFMDITDTDSVAALITQIDAQFGRIDGLVNNAYPRNANYGRELTEVTYSDFVENTGLHLGGYFLTMQQFAAYFKARGQGSIVNMSSIYGVIAPRFEIYAGTSMTMPVEYAAIKAGVVHLTRYFAQAFKKDGVRVNALSPGGVIDGQPQEFLVAYNRYCGAKGMLEADDLVGSLIYLLSTQSRYVTGQNLIVDDGFSV